MVYSRENGDIASNTPTDGLLSDRETPLSEKALSRKENDRITRQNAEKIGGMNPLFFFMALFMGFDEENLKTVKDFDEGLNSDEAISALATSLSVDKSYFKSTIQSYRSGDISLLQAATRTREHMDVSKADFARAAEVVAQHAEAGNPLLELIASKESNGDYNIAYGGKRVNATEMSINDVIAWQKQYTDNGSPSSAIGKFQFIRKTLTGLRDELGLTGDELFDEKMQDLMAEALLERRGYSDYKAGIIPEDEFMENIAKEWASMPKDESGLSYYAGDGLNKAHTTPETLLLAMRHAKDRPDQSPHQRQFNEGGVVVADLQQPDPLPFNNGQGVDQVALNTDANAITSPAPDALNKPAAPA